MSRFLPVWLPGAPAQACTTLAAANVHPLQTLLNGSRLGLYEPCRRLFNRAIGKDPNEGVFITAITAGAFTGCIGGNYFLFFLPSLRKKVPFVLIKNTQSVSRLPALPYQGAYASLLSPYPRRRSALLQKLV